jgi:START domain
MARPLDTSRKHPRNLICFYFSTVKELFATHLALLWMATKSQEGGAHKGKNLSEDEHYKLKFLIKSVKSLVSHRPFLEQVHWITTQIEGQQKRTYKLQEIEHLLNNFNGANSPAQDNRLLGELQDLYGQVHKYFMQKAGNYDLPYDLSQGDEGDYLFSKQVQEGQAVLGTGDKSSFIDSPGKKGRDNRKDIIQVAHGEDHTDNMDFRSEDSNIEESPNVAHHENDDFAFLKYCLDSTTSKDWRVDHANSSATMKIFRKHHLKGWSNVAYLCVAQLDHIPKHIVFKAIEDMNLRAKWDHSFGPLEVLEHDKEHDTTYFKINVTAPHHMQKREAVLVKKVLKDFPELHKISIVQHSVSHARAPENLKTSVRVE